MKKEKKITLKGIFLLAVAVMLAAKLIFDFNGFWKLFSMAGSAIVSVLGYILVGFIIAYILNSYINFWRNKILKKWTKNPKVKKYLTIIIGYVSFAGVLTLFIFLIVPALRDSIVSLGKEIPGIIDELADLYTNLLSDSKVPMSESVSDAIESAVNGAVDSVVEWFDLSKITTIVTKTTSIVFNAVMGVMVSVYMLIEKENTALAADKILFAVFPEKTTSRIKWVARKTNDVFQKYFTGKIIQAMIVGVVAYIVFTIAQIPYAILFAMIIGVFNMVPYIGPWVGAVPVVVVCLADSFWLGVIAVICVLIVQALDNWIISPKVIGDQIGISPLLILIGLCVGGAVFGIPGMIIGDVLAALVKVFFYDTYVEIKGRKKIRAKKLEKAKSGVKKVENPSGNDSTSLTNSESSIKAYGEALLDCFECDEDDDINTLFVSEDDGYGE